MNRHRMGPRVDILHALTVGVCTVIVSCFAGLIPAGHWQDEFFTFAAFRKGGLQFYVERLLTWSPRPVSELLIYAYARVVGFFGRPLITPVLVLLWMTLIAGASIAVVSSARAGRATRRTMLVIVAGAVALFLLGHPVSEVFYWPQGSMAYIPTLAVLVMLFGLFLVGVDSRSLRVACAVALVLAATVSELGAMFVAAFAGMQLVSLVVRAALRRDSVFRNLMVRATIPWILPLIVAAGVFVLMKYGRLNSAAEVFGDPAIAHHAYASLIHTVPQYIMELVSLDGQTLNSRNIWLGAVAKTCYFAGVYVGIRSIRQSLKAESCVQLIMFIIAIVAASFMSLFGAFYQFGVVCCERHDTMRQCMSILLLGSIAAVLAQLGRGGAKQHDADQKPRAALAWCPALILCAVIVSSLASGKLLANDYRRYGQFVAARSQTWASGAARGPAMVVTQVTPGLIVGGVVRPAGEYVRSDETPWFLAGILDFFGKKSMTLTSP